MVKETKTDKLRHIANMIINLAVGILMGALIYGGIVEFFPNSFLLRMISLFIFTPIFFFFLIFINGMGHTVAAWLLKYRVHFIALGIIGFNPEQRKFQRVKDFEQNRIDSFVQYSPTWPLKGRWGERIVSFAGPFATIVLGIVFLLLHTYVGEITEYTTLPKNIHIPKILDENGKAFFNPDKNPYARVLPHKGFQFLAVVCFIGALFKLLPWKIEKEDMNDGRAIFESFSKSEWSIANWCLVRIFAANLYDQSLVSDTEWRNIRENRLWVSKDEKDIEGYLRYFAWDKTDPEAFITIVKQSLVELRSLDDDTRLKYIISYILCNQNKEGLPEILPEILPASQGENDILFLFAKSLLEYAAGQHEEAIKTVAVARETYSRIYGSIADEEEFVFLAIENNSPLPELKWPPLNEIYP